MKSMDNELFDLREVRWAAMDKVYRFLPQTKAAIRLINETRTMRRPGKQALCSLLFGESGTGKSTILRKYDAQEPLRDDGTKATLYVETPSPFSQMAFVDAFLRALGLPVIGRQKLDVVVGRIVDGAREQGKDLVLLDEISHVVDHRKRDGVIAYWITDFIKANLLDAANLAVVMSGIPVARRLMQMNTQLATRTLFIQELKPYDLDLVGDRDLLRKLLKDLERAAGLERPLFGADDGPVRRIGVATGCIHANILKLMKQAVGNATLTEADGLTLQLLAEAAAELAEPHPGWTNAFLVKSVADLLPGRSHTKRAADGVRVTGLHQREKEGAA